PPQALARDADVGAALSWVVGGKGTRHDARARTGQVEHLPGELQHGALERVAEILRPGEAWRPVHHRDAAANQVVDVAEAARLAAVAENGDVLAAKGLHDEVGHHASVLAVHSRAVGIEYAHDLDVERVLAVV